MLEEKYLVLFEPLKIKNLEIKNRYVMEPMGPGGFCDEQGAYTERAADYYVERAKGGAGLIITGTTMVENEVEVCSLPSLPCATLNPNHFIQNAKQMTERVHAYGAKFFCQLTGGFGRVSIPSILGKTAIAPSPIPHRWIDGVVCREMTVDEIHYIVRKFGEAALVCKKAGFDGVEIHALHEGYLLDQFAISFFNQRTDQYGGSLENRLRFATEIVQEIKKTCGADYPVSLRFGLKSMIKDWRQGGLPGEEFEEKGRDIEEGIETAKAMEAAGYDCLNADVGTYDSWYWTHPPMYQAKGLYLPYNEILKRHVDIPVITAGRMEDPDLASDAIRNKQTDFIGMARPLLADPDIPNKIRAGKYNTVRPCLSCQEACMGRLQHFTSISCAVNPAAGREKTYALEPAVTKKKIMVVGGGVAGCEAARNLHLRGHVIDVFEKSDHLGGNLIPGGAPDFKEDDLALARWYTNELVTMGIPVHYNTTVTQEQVEAGDYDCVIIATGSKPKRMTLEGSDRVFTAEDVLLLKEDVGESAVIIGGGLVGCELALWLEGLGKKVTLVEYQPDILQLGGPLCTANSDMIRDLIAFKNVDLVVNSMVTGARDGGFVIKDRETNEETVLMADSAVVAVGYVSERSLYEELRFSGPELHLIGDAGEVSSIMYAIWNAYEVTKNI
ncbi:FAD-dependent oxidoreductase [Cryobacterium glucosi]|uniref:2-enoate reductase n=2 Tax=Bacteria TaxID=2 RepID=A0ABY2ISI6_9MICO|nr:FAD-dependent oxidoreductase [Cryobacterium glucosi]TFC21842.1 2-enoate reductase [Cryobacterium glucosi]